MANGKDWTESGPLELPRRRSPSAQVVKYVWWTVIVAAGAWALLKASKDTNEIDSMRPDASIVRDAGSE
jgi:hypothetical protein